MMDATEYLEALSQIMTDRDLDARVIQQRQDPPFVRVVNRQTGSLAEDITCAPWEGEPFYWWSWKDPICPVRHLVSAAAHPGRLYGEMSALVQVDYMNADDQAMIRQALFQAVINVYGPWCDRPNNLPWSERARAADRVQRARRELAATQDTCPMPTITLTGLWSTPIRRAN